MHYNFKNLVFEGGGVKGIAYGGALEALDKKGVLSNITRVAGTSAGAINATLLALDYSSAEVSKIIAETDFKKFGDVMVDGGVTYNYPINLFDNIKYLSNFVIFAKCSPEDHLSKKL